MEKINFGQSLKNITVPDKKTHQQMLINSTEKFNKNLERRTHFFLNPRNKSQANKFGFKSLKTPHSVPELKPFKDELISLIKDVQYDDFLNPLQQKLKNVKAEINSEPKVIIPADKTTNFYRMDPDK